MEKIGFIGLGIMGKPMARHLIKAGYPLSILSSSASAGELKSEGATLFDNASELSANCDVVITMLPDSPEVQEIVSGNKGVLSGIKKGALFIDMSSIDPSVSVTIHHAMKTKGVESLDAIRGASGCGSCYPFDYGWWNFRSLRSG
jgi:2-hydroxy-3-oxopropionate reductase